MHSFQPLANAVNEGGDVMSIPTFMSEIVDQQFPSTLLYRRVLSIDGNPFRNGD